jgi:hypothetical protein
MGSKGNTGNKGNRGDKGNKGNKGNRGIGEKPPKFPLYFFTLSESTGEPPNDLPTLKFRQVNYLITIE